IPAWAWVVAAVLGLFISGFNAWREEHATVATKEIDPEVELRRPEFERAVAKLNREQEAVLTYVLRAGDAHAPQLRERYFREQLRRSISAHDADMLLTIIADTGLLEVKEKGNAYGRYRINPV